jgi:hypothetical protein
MVTKPPPADEAGAAAVGVGAGETGGDAGVGLARIAVAETKQPNQSARLVTGRENLGQGNRSIAYLITSFSTLVFVGRGAHQNRHRDVYQGLASLETRQTSTDDDLKGLQVKAWLMGR